MEYREFMSYREFMKRINYLVNENMSIKWTLVQVKKEAKDLGINLENDLGIIQLIEIAKGYNTEIY